MERIEQHGHGRTRIRYDVRQVHRTTPRYCSPVYRCSCSSIRFSLVIPVNVRVRRQVDEPSRALLHNTMNWTPAKRRGLARRRCLPLCSSTSPSELEYFPGTRVNLVQLFLRPVFEDEQVRFKRDRDGPLTEIRFNFVTRKSLK